MTAAQWNQRIENEYRAMCSYPINSVFSWRIAPGQRAPRVKEYLVTYNVQTVVKGGVKFKAQHKTEVSIRLSDSPGGAPTVRIVGGNTPYLPNFYTNGNLCLGTIWQNEPNLWKLVINIGRVLTLDPDCTNPGSPANPSAAADWNDRTSGLRKYATYATIKFPRPVGY